jgi:hypothetical protein
VWRMKPAGFSLPFARLLFQLRIAERYLTRTEPASKQKVPTYVAAQKAPRPAPRYPAREMTMI